MSARVLPIFLSTALLAAVPQAIAGPAASDAQFFNQLDGKWKGPGQIVAGKYKGTKFVCDFLGTSPKDVAGTTLEGSCRVGVFTQKMSAKVRQGGKSYKGTFLDGAKGEGLDVIAGNVTEDRVVLTLKRKDLKGAMLARLASDNQMNVTISVRVADELVPVIGMKLSRVDPVQVGSVK